MLHSGAAARGAGTRSSPVWRPSSPPPGAPAWLQYAVLFWRPSLPPPAHFTLAPITACAPRHVSPDGAPRAAWWRVHRLRACRLVAVDEAGRLHACGARHAPAPLLEQALVFGPRHE